jgi:hypothetical protein
MAQASAQIFTDGYFLKKSRMRLPFPRSPFYILSLSNILATRRLRQM